MSALPMRADPAGWLEILDVATLLEPDPHAVRAWYHQVPIQPLGDETAATLVGQGRGNAVLAFLLAIVQAERSQG